MYEFERKKGAVKSKSSVTIAVTGLYLVLSRPVVSGNFILTMTGG